MSAEDAALVRPRTTGELLDDGWRLYFGDAPILLLLNGLFLAPACGAIVLLVGLPASGNSTLWLLAPVSPLALLVLTGLGSGACQEWFRARAERRTPSFSGCLTTAFARAWSHLAARAFTLSFPLLFFGAVVMCAWAILQIQNAPSEQAGGRVMALLVRLLWLGASGFLGFVLYPLLGPVHAFLASGKGRSLADLGEYFRLARYDKTRSAVVIYSRLALLALAVVNLHLLVAAGLFVLSDLAGFDASFIALQLAINNPVYDLALVLLAWLLLAPFFEACNYLLHVDARARQEGLDLQIQVRHVFPQVERQRVGALVILLGVLFLGGAPGRAAETPYDAVHAARVEVERIRQEAKTADPYNGAHFQVALDQTAGRLEGTAVRGRFDWFGQAIDGFSKRPKDDALKVLESLDDRLALLEETLPREDGGPKTPSRDDLKDLLQQPGVNRPVVDARPEDETEKPKEKKKPEEEQQDPQEDNQGGSRPHQVMMGPTGIPGCGQTGLLLLAGLALAVVVVGAVLFIASRNKGPRPSKAPLVPAKTMQQKTERHEPSPIERPAAELWREADEQARNEQHLQAVRTLYLAVLSLLHRRQLLRFEPTRTNGEYIQQVRLAPQAPAALHTVFEHFTGLFERKWYGDRACDAAEFAACRKLAEEIQTEVREM